MRAQLDLLVHHEFRWIDIPNVERFKGHVYLVRRGVRHATVKPEIGKSGFGISAWIGTLRYITHDSIRAHNQNEAMRLIEQEIAKHCPSIEEDTCKA